MALGVDGRKTISEFFSTLPGNDIRRSMADISSGPQQVSERVQQIEGRKMQKCDGAFDAAEGGTHRQFAA